MATPKARWDPIPIMYTKLFPKLLEACLIALIYTPPPKPPFHKWYDGNANFDCHVGNPSNSTGNCTTLKYKVQELIKAGALKFENLNQPKEVEDLSSNPFSTRIEI